jgi:hypothetical protein
MDEFTWQPLNKEWKYILNNPNFVIKDCTGDGNCQFRSIETALKEVLPDMTHKKLRYVIANHIKQLNDQDFQTILLNYRLELENGEFEGKWDPYKIQTKESFINEITKFGMNYQGDNVTLGLLSKALKIDFLIFNNDIKEYYPIQNDHKYFVFLYYEKPFYGHYKTIGYKKENGSIQTIFKRKNLPLPLMNGKVPLSLDDKVPLKIEKEQDIDTILSTLTLTEQSESEQREQTEQSESEQREQTEQRESEQREQTEQSEQREQKEQSESEQREPNKKWKGWTLDSLREICELLGLPMDGSKEDLYKRLDKHIKEPLSNVLSLKNLFKYKQHIKFN